MYAILDIETTGAIQKGITEIAIYKFDGHEIVDQLLVNPEIPIQPFSKTDRYQ
jgi:DNA polymerase-3 subunit epsilon